MDQPTAAGLGLLRQACACFGGFLLLAMQGQAQNVVMTTFPLSGTNGAFSHGQLIQASDGNFYGTAQLGGATTNPPQPFYSGIGNGCVFKMTPDGTITALASFFGTNGAHPWGGAWSKPMTEICTERHTTEVTIPGAARAWRLV